MGPPHSNCPILMGLLRITKKEEVYVFGRLFGFSGQFGKSFSVESVTFGRKLRVP